MPAPHTAELNLIARIKDLPAERREYLMTLAPLSHEFVKFMLKKVRVWDGIEEIDFEFVTRYLIDHAKEII
jgi:hypothetical protein